MRKQLQSFSKSVIASTILTKALLWPEMRPNLMAPLHHIRKFKTFFSLFSSWFWFQFTFSLCCGLILFFFILYWWFWFLFKSIIPCIPLLALRYQPPTNCSVFLSSSVTLVFQFYKLLDSDFSYDTYVLSIGLWIALLSHFQ